MVSWDRAAAQLEKLAELQPKDYDKVMKPEDILWVNQHLALATMNPATDVAEFSKLFIDVEPPKRVAAFTREAPTYAQLRKKFPAKRRRLPQCNCAIQDYCDICQEN